MLSILIVNWNTRDLLRSCLVSIAKFPPKIPYEVIVIDNDSHDESLAMVQTQFPSVRAVAAGGNTGYAHGNNLAFGLARGDWLLTLNPDTEFLDNSLQKSIDCLAQHAEWGVLGIRQIGPDEKTQNSIRGWPSILGILGQFSGLDTRYPESKLGSYSLPKFDYSTTQPAIQPMGTFLLFRRLSLVQAADPTAPFDERFPIFFNEVDLLRRLADAGVQCGYCAEASVLHHHGSGTKQVRKSMIWESHRSLVRYFEKHLTGWRRVALPMMALASTIVAFVRAKGYHAGFRPQHHNL